MNEEEKSRKEHERRAEIIARIADKLQETEGYLEEFKNIEIPEFEDYKGDIKSKAVCERYFEKIIEPLIALSFLIIRLEKFQSPESEEHAFFILANNNLISEDFAKKLKDAKDMRNRIVHNYISVEDIIVYKAVTEEIINDAHEFIEIIKKFLQVKE
jgi:uncharacterized protein YutE (UPF0331/DUF86 family)